MLDNKYYVPKKGGVGFINEKLTIQQWNEYISDYDFGPVAPSRVVLHHTLIPTLEQWRGLSSMQSMEGFYKGKGWTAGPHIYAAPDGIWLATPLKTIGIHANSGNYGYVAGKLWYSVGVEMVGNYDKSKPTGAVWQNTLAVLCGLLTRMKSSVEVIHFHREYNTGKSCPGNSVQKPWVDTEVRIALSSYQIGKPNGLPVCSESTITKEKFVSVLTTANSPAKDVAEELFDIAAKEGINPAVALAFFQHESTYGKAGITATYNTHNWGNVRSPEDTSIGEVFSVPGRGNFARYRSWQDGLLDWCKRLKGPKYAGSGLTTVEVVVPKYAPSSDGNAPTAYITSVINAVNSWKQPIYRVKIDAFPHLRVREGPRIGYPIVRVIPDNQEVEVDGTKNEGEGDWYRLADGTGFISSEYAIKIG